MNRRQWGWIAAIGLALLFALITGKYAYDANAIGARTAGLVTAATWAVPILAGLAGLVGALGAIKDSFKSFVIRVVNSRAARLMIMALSVAVGVLFLVAALRVEPPRTWSCSIQSKRIAAPDRPRCAEGGFARMRSFRLRLLRTNEVHDQPTLRAWVNDRRASSVAIDSDRGGLCVATGPDQPTRGESRLVLSPDCGTDQLYMVNLHLCDTAVVGAEGDDAAELRAAVKLEIREGNNANAVECK